MKNKTIQILLISVLLSGCTTTPSRSVGTLGDSEYKNVVILGEGVSQENATHYANKYYAKVIAVLINRKPVHIAEQALI